MIGNKKIYKIGLIVVALLAFFLISSCGNSCAAKGCDSGLSPVNGGEYCEKHTCGFYCDVENCEYEDYHLNYEGEHDPVCFAYAPSEEGIHYCDEHRCDAEGCGGYVEYVRDEKKFWSCCALHGCDVCGEVRVDYVNNKSVCEKHMLKECAVDGCSGYIEDFGDTYCENHECDWCNEMALSGEKYCEEHLKESNQCRVDGCENAVCVGFRFCEDHKCKNDGCINESEDGYYCETHGCGEYRCIYPRMEGSKYCETHQAIRDGNIDPEVGMSKDDVLKSTWGSPDERNVTEYDGFTAEQWIYYDIGYIYFDDGIVYAIHDL